MMKLYLYGKYPTFSWSGDAFTNWLTQQAVNIPTQLATTAVNALTSTNPVTATTNVVGSIASLIGGFYTASIMPNIVGGQNTGDVNFSSEFNTFTFRCMRAKTEYLKVIDEFFSLYGYKVNSLKIPNITGRKNWNYVKTININLIADIPQEDIETLKNIFNNGVTLWHNPSTFLDYSQDNNILGA